MKKIIFSSLLAVLTLSLCPKISMAQDTENKVYGFAGLENPPTYPGGIENFYRFLGQNIKYPADAVKNNIQGNVFLSFTIEKNGAVNDLKIDRGLGYGTDEEALRVVKLAGMWNPGTIEGKAVAVKYNIPVKFTLNKKTTTTAAPTKHTTGAVASDDNQIYSFLNLEHPPTFPGGVKAFYEFLGKNVKYPALAVKNGVQGSVYTTFTVEKDGKITDIKIDRKAGSGLDEEALRVIALSPKWNPGTQNGKAIRVKYSIPIKFALNSTAPAEKG